MTMSLPSCACCSERRRQGDAALPVELALLRAAEEVALHQAALAREASRAARSARSRTSSQAARGQTATQPSKPARTDDAVREVLAQARGQRDAVLVIQPLLELAEEHTGPPSAPRIGARPPNAHHFTPPHPTLQHQDAMFAPPVKLAARVPVLSRAGLRIDYADEGQGRPVVLVHSSVSGNRQWRTLTEALRDRYRVLAVNLYGYGETTPWPGDRAAVARPRRRSSCWPCATRLAVLSTSSGIPSAGRSRSRRAPARRPGRPSLVLLEPNPFHLLEQAGRTAAWLETQALRDDVTARLAAGDWARASERFADYWLGEGTWSAMPEKAGAGHSPRRWRRTRTNGRRS